VATGWIAFRYCPLCPDNACQFEGAGQVDKNPDQVSKDAAHKQEQAFRRETIQDAINRVAAALEAIQEQTEPAEQRHRAEKDLGAQLDMARWACVMVWVGMIQALVTLGSLFFIWKTLEHTADQARSAKRAIESSEKTAIKQLRAYVTVKQSGISDLIDGGAFIAFAELHNSGQTPARDVRSVFGTLLAKYPPEDDKIDFSVDRTKGFSRCLLGPGDKHVVNIERSATPLSHRDYIALKNGQMAVYLIGEIRYFDAFSEKERVTTFCGFCSGDNINGTKGTVSMMDQGNDYI